MRAYEEQIEAIERMDGKLIVMASRALAQVAKGPEEYAKVYDRILTQVRQPVILHWLGEMFDPALDGYWGATDHLEAMETFLAIISDNRGQGRRNQNLLAVEGKGNRHAAPAARRCTDVYRRRLQLC